MQEFIFITTPTYLPKLLQGAMVTLQLTVISMVVAVILGLLVALGRISGPRPLAFLLNCYVEIWRDVPLVVQLLLIYFALPELEIILPAFVAAIIGLSLNLAAYLSEVFRATILSIDKGQREAVVSLGMSNWQVYTRVILPQALLIAVPTIGGYFISLLKDCSLVSFISVNELLREGTIIISSNFKSMQIYMLVAIIYFVMSFTASIIMRHIEWRLTPKYLRRS